MCRQPDLHGNFCKRRIPLEGRSLLPSRILRALYSDWEYIPHGCQFSAKWLFTFPKHIVKVSQGFWIQSGKVATIRRMRGKTGHKTEEYFWLPSSPPVHGEAQRRSCIKMGQYALMTEADSWAPRQNVCFLKREIKVPLLSLLPSQCFMSHIVSPRMPETVTWKVSSWCQLDGIRFSKENPLGKIKLAPGTATWASCGHVRKCKKKNQNQKKRENK